MKKQWLMAALMAAGAPAFADNEINYNYLELGYGYLDLPGGHADGLYLDGSVELSERFYLGGFYEQKDSGPFDFDRYGLNLGFHSNGTGRTDFYSEFNLGQLDVRFNDSLTYGLTAGTRTAFNERFELISKVGVTHIDKADDSFYEVGLKGLFKINAQNALTAEIESLDGDPAVSLGWRFSF